MLLTWAPGHPTMSTAFKPRRGDNRRLMVPAMQLNAINGRNMEVNSDISDIRADPPQAPCCDMCGVVVKSQTSQLGAALHCVLQSECNSAWRRGRVDDWHALSCAPFAAIEPSPVQEQATGARRIPMNHRTLSGGNPLSSRWSDNILYEPTLGSTVSC